MLSWLATALNNFGCSTPLLGINRWNNYGPILKVSFIGFRMQKPEQKKSTALFTKTEIYGHFVVYF